MIDSDLAGTVFRLDFALPARSFGQHLDSTVVYYIYYTRSSYSILCLYVCFGVAGNGAYVILWHASLPEISSSLCLDEHAYQRWGRELFPLRLSPKAASLQSLEVSVVCACTFRRQTPRLLHGRPGLRPPAL